MSAGERFERIMAVTLAGFESSLRQHMPGGAYRDFCLWAISGENSRREEYLQAVGIIQLARLTVGLLAGLVDDQDWPRLAEHSVLMNVYQIHEIVSDNMAIGLAPLLQSGNAIGPRRDLLIAFNDAMVARLNGDGQPAAESLAPLLPGLEQVSSFDQSLNRSKRRTLAETFLKGQNGHDLDALEYSVWPSLVANVETCHAMTQSMAVYRAGPLLREGLTNRYRAVNRLLEARPLTRPQLADVGADAILVMPTLAYYVSVLAEIVRPLDPFPQVIEDGTLADALYDAALLVRLLNDIGTELLVMPASEQAALLDTLRLRLAEWSEAATLPNGLTAAGGQGTQFTRIHKDVMFGEFNVSLYGLEDIYCGSEALQAFGDNLAYFSQLYTQRRASLGEAVRLIDRRLANEKIGRLILRFVQFHEKLYSQPFQASAGEYAI